MSITVGDTLEGVIKGLKSFGAFVELPDQKVGLVHISEVADTYVKEIGDFLKDGDTVQVKVLKIEENGKIALSIKQAKVQKATPPPSFEDMMSKFMKDSSERQVAIKRQLEGRKGYK